MQNTDDIVDELLAFVCHDKAGNVTGSGTAFWCDVSGEERLITAAHIPWPLEPPNKIRPRVVENLFISWWQNDGNYGTAEVTFVPHSVSLDLDCVGITFVSGDRFAKGKVFKLEMSPQGVGDELIGVGFLNSKNPFFIASNIDPKVQQVAQPLTPVVAEGPVHLAKVNEMYLIEGAAGHGQSGGPVFKKINIDSCSDKVVGLISGGPHPNILIQENVTDAFLVTGSVNFE